MHPFVHCCGGDLLIVVACRYGTEVQPGVLAPIHSHFFCARLDMTVDGWVRTHAFVYCSVHVPLGLIHSSNLHACVDTD